MRWMIAVIVMFFSYMGFASVEITGVSISPSANILPGTPITFTMNTIGETPTAYYWNFNDDSGIGTQKTSTNQIVHAFSAADTYYLWLGVELQDQPSGTVADSMVFPFTIFPNEPKLTLADDAPLFGQPYAVTISATGVQPISISATTLPGFTFNNGILFGTLNDFQTRTVTFSAVNDYGADSKSLIIAPTINVSGNITASKGTFKRNSLKDNADTLTLTLAGPNLPLVGAPRTVFTSFSANMKPIVDCYFGTYLLCSIPLDAKGNGQDRVFKGAYNFAKGQLSIMMKKGSLEYLESDAAIDYALSGHAKIPCRLVWRATRAEAPGLLGENTVVSIFKITNKLTKIDSGKLVGSKAP